MNNKTKILIASTMALLMLAGEVCDAGIVVEEFNDKDDWIEAVGGNFTTIGFNDQPQWSFITDQYEDLGAVFTEGNDFIDGPGEIIYPNDGWGLSGFGDPITVEFTQPMQWVGVDFPGGISIDLYVADELIYETEGFDTSGAGNFGGIVSNTPFDKVVIYDSFDGAVFIDDLHFGPPIPAPGALPLLGLALLAHQRRRRR